MIHRPHMYGFTLIETLVAIAILTVAVSGPLFTANRAIVVAETSNDQLTASSLAQEGIEYVIAMRDDAYLAAYKAGGTNVSQVAWDNFTKGTTAIPTSIHACVSSTCTLDPSLPMGTDVGASGGVHALHTCAGLIACNPLYLSGGVYTQNKASGGTLTPYTRTIQATAISSTDEQITSTVTWNMHGKAYHVTFVDHLTPWQ